MATIANICGRQTLRAATHDVHERLHGHPMLARLAEGTIDRDGYVWLLTKWWGFHVAVEAALAGAPAVPTLDFDKRSKMTALRADLAYLGLDGAAIDALPLCPGLPYLDSAAATVGTAYVVEGSTMGGRVLAKALVPLLGEGESGRRFLLGYGANHGRMWKAFMHLIEDVAANQAACDAMTRAAGKTFTAFEDWLA